MKHNRTSFTVLLCLLLLTYVPVQAQKVGLLMDSYVLDRWAIDQKFFTEKVKSLGGECLVEVPDGDPAIQVKLGKKLIDLGVDVLVIIPSDGLKAAEIVALATQAHIPVIAYDRFIHSKDVSLYLSYNNEKVGKLQAEYLVKKAPTGNYLLVNGPASDNNAILFRNGQLQVLKSYVDQGKIKIIGDIVLSEWSEIEAFMKVEEFLSSSKVKPDAIVAGNDALANGAIQVLPKELLGKVAISGQDADISAVKNILRGSQSMTVYKPIQALAETAALMAMRLAKKEALKDSTVMMSGNIKVQALLLDPIAVDKSNLKETVVKDHHLSISEMMDKK